MTPSSTKLLLLSNGFPLTWVFSGPKNRVKGGSTLSERAILQTRPTTVKLGFKELLNKEQLVNSEPFPVTNMPVHLINSEQIGFSEQLCDDQKVP